MSEPLFARVIQKFAEKRATCNPPFWTGVYDRPTWMRPEGTQITDHNKRIPTPAEPPVTQAKITQHQEREFTFNDGTVKRSCPVEFCSWGMPSGRGICRKHSNGLTFVLPTVEPTDDNEGVEITEDEPTPSDLSPVVVVAGEDDPEPEDEESPDEQPDPAVQDE